MPPNKKIQADIAKSGQRRLIWCYPYMECQLKKVALITYGIFYLALIGFGLFEIATSGQFSGSSVISTIFTGLYLLGFFGYVLNKRIWTAIVWRRLFYLLCFGTLVQLLVALLFNGSQNPIETIVGAIIGLPIIYCLYQYSKSDRSMWLNTAENIKANVIDNLFAKDSTLFVEKTNGDNKAAVSVSKEAGSYSVTITRSVDGKEESFTNAFNNLGHLATFIEQYTMIRVSDFEEKYA
jgi:hypothetical protein